MVEVVKPIIIANAVYQGLQRSYFSIRYLALRSVTFTRKRLLLCDR